MRGKKKEEQPCKQQEEKALAMTPNVTARSFRLFERHIKKNEFLFFFFLLHVFRRGSKTNKPRMGDGEGGTKGGAEGEGGEEGGKREAGRKTSRKPKRRERCNQKLKSHTHTKTQKRPRKTNKQSVNEFNSLSCLIATTFSKARIVAHRTCGNPQQTKAIRKRISAKMESPNTIHLTTDKSNPQSPPHSPRPTNPTRTNLPHLTKYKPPASIQTDCHKKKDKSKFLSFFPLWFVRFCSSSC